ncbi:hypothetical protein VH567_13405 [Sphingomonas sp. 4RDLI-65]|uniref:hypothetical protein n=1 Tax=Sphingomonas sp. 4RDLI-65 TaxID=3111641 RepID=UPI003C243E8F
MTSGGFAALGTGVRLRISDGIRFLLGYPDEPVIEGDLIVETVDGVLTGDLLLNRVPVISADASAAIVHSAWLVGSTGAVACQVSLDPRRPIVGGTGNEVQVVGLRWTLPT